MEVVWNLRGRISRLCSLNNYVVSAHYMQDPEMDAMRLYKDEGHRVESGI